jgi:hypothetical protein
MSKGFSSSKVLIVFVSIVCRIYSQDYPRPFLSLRCGALPSAQTSRHGRPPFSDVCNETDVEGSWTVRNTLGAPEKPESRALIPEMAHMLVRGDEKNAAQRGAQQPRTPLK